MSVDPFCGKRPNAQWLLGVFGEIMAMMHVPLVIEVGCWMHGRVERVDEGGRNLFGFHGDMTDRASIMGFNGCFG
jgi:hypothetical protein